MDAQTIAIIGVGMAIWGTMVPLFTLLLFRVDRLTRRMDHLTSVVTALANHRHGADGAPTFILPAD